MNLRATGIHITACLLIGGAIAAFAPVRWIAASLWVSAAMFINGSLAALEDAQPSGFDNPTGEESVSIAAGMGAIKFWLQSLAVVAVIAGLGLVVQFW
jgi:hypothetical protein